MVDKHQCEKFPPNFIIQEYRFSASWYGKKLLKTVNWFDFLEFKKYISENNLLHLATEQH